MSTKIADLTLTKQTGNTLTLNAKGKYVSDDSYFGIEVQSGAAMATIASTDASIESDSSDRNISAAIGTKSSSAPLSGYYLKIGASGTGASAITTAGWLAEGTVGTATATNSFYFPVIAATASVGGTNTVTPSASISGSHVTLSNTDNGVSVTATGGGSASASVSATATQTGLVVNGDSIGTATITGSSQTTSASSFISGVTLGIPQSGTNSFAVTLPNGNNDTITLTFVVDTYGNWSVE